MNFEFVSLPRGFVQQFGATNELPSAATASTVPRQQSRRAGALHAGATTLLWYVAAQSRAPLARRRTPRIGAPGPKQKKKEKKIQIFLLIFLSVCRRIDGEAIDVSDASGSGASLRVAASGCLWRDAAVVRAGATSTWLLVALETHSSALHVFVLPPLGGASAAVERRRARLAGLPVPTGGAVCVDALPDAADTLLVGLLSGGTRCVRFGADGAPLAAFELQAASVVARLIGGLVPTLVGSRGSSAVLSLASVPVDGDTLVVGACADWQLRVWSVARRTCVLALPLTPETRDGAPTATGVFDAPDSDAPLLFVRLDAASRRVVVLMSGRDVPLQCQLFSLAVADDGRPQLAVQAVLFAPTAAHAGAGKKLVLVDVLAVQSRVWLLCVDGAEPLLFAAPLPPADSDAVECGAWLLASPPPARLPLDDAADDAERARRLVAACGGDAVEQVLVQWRSSSPPNAPLAQRLCVAAQAAAAAGGDDASAQAWQRLTRMCVAARVRAEQPLALATLRGGVPIVVGAHAVAVVRNASVPELLLAQARLRLPAPLAPAPSVHESADAPVDAAVRDELAPTFNGDVALLLRCAQQARALLGEAAFGAFVASVLAGTDVDQAAFEPVTTLLCTPHGVGAHVVESFAALSDPLAAVDALLSALDDFDALPDSAAPEPDVVDARKAWLVRAASASPLLLHAAAYAARNAAHAALDVALGALLVLYSVLRRVGVARLSPALARQLRGATLTRAKRVVSSAALAASALLAAANTRTDAPPAEVDVDVDMALPGESRAAEVEASCAAVALARELQWALCGRVARSAALEAALGRNDVVGTSPLAVAPLLGRALTLSCRHTGATAVALLGAQQHDALLAYAPLALRLVVGEPVVRHCAALAALALGTIDADAAARELEAVGPSLTREDALLLLGDAPPLAGLDDAGARLDHSALQDARLLASYYMHVLAVFEARRLAAQAVRFAELALPYARIVDPRAAASLRASAFRLHLSLDAFEAAYRAMLPHSDAPALRLADCDEAVRNGGGEATAAHAVGDESAAAVDERWRGDALRRLVVVLCERGALQTLCELPFVGLVERVRELLFAKAQQAPLDVQPDYYAIMYAFTVFRGDYRRAAAAMYECATRLAVEAPGGDALAALQRRVDALDAALTALRLSEPHARWLPRMRSLPHQSPKRALGADETALGDETEPRTALDIVSLADMERERAMAAARLELVRSDAALGGLGSGELAADDAVVLLCHAGDYARAMSVARLCGADMSPLFDSLVAACVSSRCETLLVDDDAIGAAGTPDADAVPTTPEASAWRALRCYLAQYDGAATGHAMYTRVAARILALDARARLPHWLRATLMRENPAALLRVYLAFASADNAAVLKDACEAIEALLVTAKRDGVKWLPLNHIDSLLALVQHSGDTSVRAQHGQLQRLLVDVVSV